MELGLSDWSATAFRRAIRRAERYLFQPLFPTWNLSNHDLSRHATRWGPERSRLAAMIELTLRGMVCLYQGEEIGMTDHPQVPQPPRDRFGRDPFRTPMQWSADPQGGFTTGVPWLPLHDPERRNVADQRDDPASMLALYRRLIELRRGSLALRHGDLTLRAGLADNVVAYERHAGRERVLVAANMGSRPVGADSLGEGTGRILLSTGSRSGTVAIDSLALDPLEGVVLRVE